MNHSEDLLAETDASSVGLEVVNALLARTSLTSETSYFLAFVDSLKGKG
jgi:hypothetical protein